jgi:signal transduction histidine kinase
MPPTKRLWSEWTPWAYVLVCAPLVLLLVELLRGALHETQIVGTLTRRDEMQELHAEAMRRGRGIEVLLEALPTSDKSWAELREEPWMAQYWSSINLEGSHHLYAAVVDEVGNIVMHTESARIGQRLQRGWYERRVADAGPDVVWTQSNALGGEEPAYDVTVPLIVAGRLVGEYHEGLDAQWLDSRVASQQRTALTRWLLVLVVVVPVDAAAIFALIFLARRQNRLWRLLRGQSRQRAREMSQLGSGLAHEIRNPLHALRINLHTLRRAFGGRSSLGEDQLVATIEESDAAIDRLDSLMRDLLQFSDPSAGEVADVDVSHEARATLNLLAEDLRRDQIEVRSEFTSESAPVRMDPVRLRQLLLNLLTLAQHRAGKTGTIDVIVTRCGDGVEIAVGDSGPALRDEQRARIFEPFQAPGETGSGLGLALVQVFAEEAGGRASWDGGAPASSRCRVWLPLARSGPKGGPT